MTRGRGPYIGLVWCRHHHELMNCRRQWLKGCRPFALHCPVELCPNTDLFCSVLDEVVLAHVETALHHVQTLLATHARARLETGAARLRTQRQQLRDRELHLRQARQTRITEYASRPTGQPPLSTTLLDLDQELARLAKEEQEIQVRLGQIQTKLEHPDRLAEFLADSRQRFSTASVADQQQLLETLVRRIDVAGRQVVAVELVEMSEESLL